MKHIALCLLLGVSFFSCVQPEPEAAAAASKQIDISSIEAQCLDLSEEKTPGSAVPLPLVDGATVGFAGSEEDFYLLSRELLQKHSPEEFVLMAEAKHPIVRVMGCYCLIRTDREKYGKTVKKVFSDTDRMSFMPGGCGVTISTSGYIVKAMYDNPDILEPLDINAE